jgi:hypothetical protein
MDAPLGQEAVGDAALIENLDGAGVKSTRARSGELDARAPLDNGDVDARQCQLARQHQPCRTSAGNHHRMFGHRHTPIDTGGTPTLRSGFAQRRALACDTP